MNEEVVYEKLTDIFRDVFDDDELEISAETNADDIEDWDSLAQINLVVAAGTKFGIEFDISEVTSLKNVGEFAALIQSKL